ncbi:hypothetical protein ACN27J_31385 [Solwaraspora sp. WMMB762]|uniref:hypothetical protein n=1 Tax=Solwaraspora sp. WMMB762 TaxID=3404120 RepID=UPI003B92A8B5
MHTPTLATIAPHRSGSPEPHGVPGRVAEISSIDLPQPRDVTSPEFNQMKRHLLDVVHREVAAGAAET